METVMCLVLGVVVAALVLLVFGLMRAASDADDAVDHWKGGDD